LHLRPHPVPQIQRDMSDSLTLSPASLSLLELIERQAALSLDVVHVWLDPVRRPASTAIRSLLHETEVAGEILKALRTGEVRVGMFQAGAIGLFPLRRGRDIVGCLIVSRPGSDMPDEATARLAIESAGALARGILESDLSLSSQLTASLAATRRTHATLRFLGQLGTYDSDRDVMHAVLHAAHIWFDLECQIYERRPDGRFVLSGALPREERPAMPLDAERAGQLIAARRPFPGDLDDLGVEGRAGDVLVLPVGGREPTWLIVLTGAIDTQVELAFEAMARVMSADLQARELARVDRWQRRLTQSPTVTQTPDVALTELLEELVTDAGAEGGLVRVLEGPGAGRVTAAVGANALGTFRTSADVPAWDPNTLELRVPAAPDVTLQVVLNSTRPLGVSAGPVIHGWVKALRPWLAEVAVGPVRHQRAEQEALAFEFRIQQEVERARRFELSLCLLLVGPNEPEFVSSTTLYELLASAIRSELRASDFFGRLLNGPLGVLLVHAGEEGGRSVTARLKARAAQIAPHLADVMQVGRAVFTPECACADDLIAEAKRAARGFRSVH